MSISNFILPLVIIITLCTINQVHLLIAYDCENTNNNLTAISIQDIEKCPDPERDYIETSTTALVIQQKEFENKKVLTCLIEITRLMWHCGMFSHSSPVEKGFLTYIHTLTPEGCQKVHHEKMFRFGNNVISNIAMNGTTSASLAIVGSLTSDGSCKSGSYTENDQTWYDVTVVVNLKIIMSDYMATVNLDEDKIRLKTDITCKYSDGYCMDSMYGQTVWKTDVVLECDLRQSLITLYQGKATIVENVNKNANEKILVVENDPKIFAFQLIKKSKLCGYDIWQTEHPKILVTFVNMPMQFRSEKQILPQNTDIFSYVNSKFLYVEQSYKRNIANMSRYTVYRRCLLHREIMRNRLLIAPLSPNALSTIIKDKLGYIGRVLGEVLYIMQCTPRMADIRRTTNCYQELPITVNNQSYFLAPITHVMQKHAIQIECNVITPPMYLIDGKWIAISPTPMEIKPPTLLKPETEQILNLNPIQPLGASGLYTQKEISKVQKMLSFGVEREAVGNIMTRKLNGEFTDNQGFDAVNLFDAQEIKNLARNTFRSIWGWFTDIGIFMSGIIGFYIIWLIFKYIVETIINGLALYKTFGCGLFLIAGVWNTLTVWVINNYIRRSPPKQNEENPLHVPEASQTDGEQGIISPVYQYC